MLSNAPAPIKCSLTRLLTLRGGIRAQKSSNDLNKPWASRSSTIAAATLSDTLSINEKPIMIWLLFITVLAWLTLISGFNIY